jgi:hypothetical protein
VSEWASHEEINIDLRASLLRCGKYSVAVRVSVTADASTTTAQRDTAGAAAMSVARLPTVRVTVAAAACSSLLHAQQPRHLLRSLRNTRTGTDTTVTTCEDNTRGSKGREAGEGGAVGGQATANSTCSSDMPPSADSAEISGISSVTQRATEGVSDEQPLRHNNPRAAAAGRTRTVGVLCETELLQQPRAHFHTVLANLRATTEKARGRRFG